MQNVNRYVLNIYNEGITLPDITYKIVSRPYSDNRGALSIETDKSCEVEISKNFDDSFDWAYIEDQMVIDSNSRIENAVINLNQISCTEKKFFYQCIFDCEEGVNFSFLGKGLFGFSNCIFLSKIAIHEVLQHTNIDVNKCFFSKEFELTNLITNDNYRVEFNESKFADLVSISSFISELNLKKCIFLNNLKIKKCCFSKATIAFNKIESEFIITDTIITDLSLSNNCLGSMKFESCKFLNTLNLSNKNFIFFVDCTYQCLSIKVNIPIPTKIHIQDYSNQENSTNTEALWDEVEDTGKFLLKVCKENNLKRSEDRAFLLYKRAERRTLKKSKQIIPLLADILGSYGRNYKKVFLWILIIIISFAIFYTISADGAGDKMSSFCTRFVNNLYFSSVTFLTIGYGDIHPWNPLIKILCAFEGFIGLFLMSYFTVSFARRVLQ